jgi:hypothetical protein
MEIMPGTSQSYPPSPPPQRSSKGLWIGLLIGVVVLCLLGFVAAGYYSGVNLSDLLKFFPSPTPSALSYDNPNVGVSLTYPLTWQYSEAGDATYGYAITFASSSDILDAPSKATQSGALLMLGTIPLSTNNLPFTVAADTMGAALDGFASSFFSASGPAQDLRTFTLSGYPAASGAFTISSDNTAPTSAYLTVVLRQDQVVLFVGLCPQAEWSQYQPTFEAIVSSATLSAP